MSLLDWYRRMTGSLKTQEAELTKQNTDLKAQNADLTTQVANLKAQMIILMSRLARVGSTSDVTAPTVSSATIDAAGTSLTLAMSETVVIGAGGNGGLTISPSGGAATVTYSSGSGTSSLVYTISRTILSSETVTRSYTQPGNGIEDSAGNDLASFSAQSITNNSTQTGASYLLDEDWSTATVGDYVGADGPGTSDIYTHSSTYRWQCLGGAAGAETVHIITDGAAHGGKNLKLDFTAGFENDTGVYFCPSAGVAGGKKLYVAQQLKYTGYNNMGSGVIKKTFRIVDSNGTTLATLDAQSGKWRLYFDVSSGTGFYDQPDASVASYGPDTFIGTYRWLELLIDFTNASIPAFSVWVDGNLVWSGTDDAAYDMGSATLKFFKVSTTFNSPAKTGNDYIQRIIANDSHIGVP